MNTKNIKWGNIYWANLGSQFGSVQSGKRPVIVISNPKNNLYSPTINVLPITSKKKNNIPVHVNISTDCGLEKESTILTEQILTIDKNQIIEYIGKCNKSATIKITKAMMLQFYMLENLSYAV